MFRATFVSKFVAKKFQKSPNLVTLQRRVSAAAAAVAGRCTKTTIFKSAKFLGTAEIQELKISQVLYFNNEIGEITFLFNFLNIGQF